MRFLISYKGYNNENGEIYFGEFKLDSESELLKEDVVVLDSALKDSLKFQRSGLGSISIESIKPCKRGGPTCLNN